MRSLITLSPIARSVSFDREFDRLFQDFFGSRSDGQWVPAADIVEKDDHYRLRVDLPGLKREDIQVSVEDGKLIIRGTRKREELEEKENLVRHERHAGEFVRTFTLGKGITASGIKAHYRDGVLEVTVPKAEEARSRLIEIS